MFIPETESIGKARWTQGDEGDAGLELKIPVSLPDSVRPRDLTVSVKDTTVLIVSHNDTRIIQWRLYAPVNEEVEWRVENDTTLVVELEKKSATVWSSLLDLPMKNDDPLLTTMDEINRMFATQLPSLPPVSHSLDSIVKNDAPAEKDGDGNDLERLLEEATQELTGEKEGEEEEDTYTAFVKADLANYQVESEEMTKKLEEVNLKLAGPDSDERKTALEQKAILEEMVRLHNECRELRSKTSSLATFLQCTLLDLQKARVNIGQTGEMEEEEYKDDDERSLNANELMTCGLKYFEDQDMEACLHFLRLAAIHHNHDQSILLLYSLYSHLHSPRGAFLLFRRAIDDENPSAIINQKVGELYDQGARHFLPLFPAAVYFYQRAAKLGSVNAMISLAQLWVHGATSSSMLNDEQKEEQRNVAKFHAWLQKAMDRGCGSAYFVKGCMYIKGEHGIKKSYAKAKEYLDAAASSHPEILRRTPQLPMMLEALRKEEEEEGGDSSSASPGSATSQRASAPSSPKTVETGNGAVTSSTARLNALSTTSRGSGTSSQPAPHRAKKAFGNSERRKVFWERACATGIAVYSVYTLTFPVRCLLLPLFYSVITPIVEAIPWLANSNADIATF